MDNFNNEIFGFGTNENNSLEQANDFNYNSISGLGESNYENEDLFSIDDTTPLVEENNSSNITNNSLNDGYNFSNDYRIGGFEEESSDQIVIQNPFAMEQSQDILLNDNLEQANNEVVEPLVDTMQPIVEQTSDSSEESDNLIDNIIPFNNTIENEQSVETVQSSQPDFISLINNLKPVESENIEQDIVSEEALADLTNSYADENSLMEEKSEMTNLYSDNLAQSAEIPVEQPQTMEENITDQEPELSSMNLYSNETPFEEEVSDFSVNLNSEDLIENIEEYAVEPQNIEENIVEEEPELNSIEVPIANEPTSESYYTNEFDTQDNVSFESEENLEEDEIVISETPIEELKKLTKYEEEYVENTDINSLFDKVSVNVKDASEIFRKNTDMKAKIDTRFDELKKLQSEVESSKQKQLDEVNKYKEEVLEKLTEKKEEIEKRLNTLKEYQANLEKEKLEFEKYKKTEQANIEKVQKEVQAAYDDRREELNSIEDALRKQKDDLDAERSQLSLDRIQYEADKNELANNLLKFNELVNSFTNGVNNAGRE